MDVKSGWLRASRSGFGGNTWRGKKISEMSSGPRLDQLFCQMALEFSATNICKHISKRGQRQFQNCITLVRTIIYCLVRF